MEVAAVCCLQALPVLLHLCCRMGPELPREAVADDLEAQAWSQTPGFVTLLRM